MSRTRAAKTGVDHTITVEDIDWPTHCPVLGVELQYTGGRGTNHDASPSLDRWDNAKGYVPGNVYVISLRANKLKNNANAEELERVFLYAKHGQFLPPPELEGIW